MFTRWDDKVPPDIYSVPHWGCLCKVVCLLLFPNKIQLSCIFPQKTAVRLRPRPQNFSRQSSFRSRMVETHPPQLLDRWPPPSRLQRPLPVHQTPGAETAVVFAIYDFMHMEAYCLWSFLRDLLISPFAGDSPDSYRQIRASNRVLFFSPLAAAPRSPRLPLVPHTGD
jgi:hypothetical protein